jgi:hypothetical protein
MDLKDFKTDLTKEEEGVWIELGEGARVKLARMNNPSYLESLRKGMKPHNLAIRRGTADAEVLDRIVATATAEAVVLDWEGLELNGEAITYTKEKCIEILLDDTLKDFRDWLMDEARNMDHFREAGVEEAAKNSQSASDGS